MDKYWDKIRQEKYDGTFERTTKALLRNQTRTQKGFNKEKRMKSIYFGSQV